MIDLAKILVAAGNGGDGCISFRREKFVPRGGPDGGDGGAGGNVFIVGDPSLNTLLHLKYRTTWKAQRGVHGGTQKKRGAKGADVRISVPIGTVVCRLTEGDATELIADIVDMAPVVIAKGGKGGAGNTRFVSAVQQEPVLAEKGYKGEAGAFLLELKLLADVGLVGQPNAGKSTLLTYCSAARPKIAPYPFTTIEPVLGVVESRHKSFVMMEIPGLIEGAHKGAGLGMEFLRHAERARLLLHIIDGLSDDVLGDWRRINLELMAFKTSLGEKPQFILVNKIDVPNVRERVPTLKKELEPQGVPLFFISAATGEGVDTLLGGILETLDNLPRPEPEHVSSHIPTVVPSQRESFTVTNEKGVYVVSAPRIERLLPLADLKDGRAMIQIWKELQRMGVVKELEKRGVRTGDTVRFGRVELEWF